MAAFKANLTLPSVMGSSFDGRKFNGMKRTVERMQKGKGKHKHVGATAITACWNYLKALQAAINIQADKVQCLESEEDLKADATIALKHMKASDFPYDCMLAWYSRRASKLFSEGAAKDHMLVEISNPWSGEPFHPFKATLGSTGGTVAEKIEIFSDMHFTQVLVPIIQKGEDGKPRLEKLCECCLEQFSDEAVDIVEMDALTTVAYNEWTMTWRALLALCDPPNGYCYKEPLGHVRSLSHWAHWTLKRHIVTT